MEIDTPSPNSVERRKNNMKITITLSQEQLNYILEYARTKSITVACNLATSLVEQLGGKHNG